MTKKKIITGVALILSLSSCFTIKPVEFLNAGNLKSSRNDTDFVMTFDLAMHNPNNWSLRLSKLETEVSIDNHFLGKASLSNVTRLKRNSDFSIPLNANASLNNLINLSALGLNLFFGNQTAVATIKGNLVLKKFIFRKKMQFEYKEKIDSRILQSWF